MKIVLTIVALTVDDEGLAFNSLEVGWCVPCLRHYIITNTKLLTRRLIKSNANYGSLGNTSLFSSLLCSFDI